MWPALDNLTHSVTLTLPDPTEQSTPSPTGCPLTLLQMRSFSSDVNKRRISCLWNICFFFFFLSESPPLWPVLMWEMEINNQRTAQEYYATALSAHPLKRFKETAKVCLNNENKWNTFRSSQWKMINQRPPQHYQHHHLIFSLSKQ